MAEHQQPMTKTEYIWDMIDRESAAKTAGEGEPLFTAENVDILEITHPRYLYMEIDNGMHVNIDLQKDALNAATKDQISLLLSSISPDRVHVHVNGSDREIPDAGEFTGGDGEMMNPGRQPGGFVSGTERDEKK